MIVSALLCAVLANACLDDSSFDRFKGEILEVLSKKQIQEKMGVLIKEHAAIIEQIKSTRDADVDARESKERLDRFARSSAAAAVIKKIYPPGSSARITDEEMATIQDALKEMRANSEWNESSERLWVVVRANAKLQECRKQMGSLSVQRLVPAPLK